MAADVSLMYWQEKLGKTQPRVAEFQYKITGAKASSSLVAGVPVLTAYDAISTQATIDNYLGTTNEFLLAAFDATAMGTDAFATIVAMRGQAAAVMSATAIVYSSTHLATVAQTASPVVAAGLTASTLETEVALGASGNVAARFVLSGLDILTSGLIVVRISWISK